MLGRVVDAVGGAGFDDAAVLHHQDAVADLADDREIVGDEDQGDADALTLAAGEFVRVAVVPVGIEADPVQQLPYAGDDGGVVQLARGAQRVGDGFADAAAGGRELVAVECL